MLLDEVFHRVVEDRFKVVFRSPAHELANLADFRNAAVAVFISFSVKFFAGHGNDFGIRISRLTEVLVENRLHLVGKFLDRYLVFRRADVENLAVADSSLIVDDPRDALHRFVDIRVGAIVPAAIDQLDGRSVKKRIHKMAEDARIPGLFAGQVIDPGTDKVERANDGVGEPLLEPVSVEHPFKKLLGACVDPAMVFYWTHDQRRLILRKGYWMFGGILSKSPGRGDPVDLASRELNDPLFVLHAKFRDLEVLDEVQLENVDRIADVEAGIGHGDEVNNHVMIGCQPFKFPLVGANVEMNVGDLAALDRLIKLVALDIKRGDLMFAVAYEALGKTCANESPGAQEKDLHEKIPIYDCIASSVNRFPWRVARISRCSLPASGNGRRGDVPSSCKH